MGITDFFYGYKEFDLDFVAFLIFQFKIHQSSFLERRNFKTNILK